MFIPLKMVLICINRYWSIPICWNCENCERQGRALWLCLSGFADHGISTEFLRHLCTPGTFHTHNPATLIWNGQPAALRPKPNPENVVYFEPKQPSAGLLPTPLQGFIHFPIFSPSPWIFSPIPSYPHDLHLASSRIISQRCCVPHFLALFLGKLPDMIFNSLQPCQRTQRTQRTQRALGGHGRSPPKKLIIPCPLPRGYRWL